jgi:hypothetical protein
MKTYYVHNNYERPYKVIISSNNVKIFCKRNDITYDYEDKPILTYKCKEIFIGKSPKCPMTEFSGGYGSKFDGNTILLHIKNNEYIHIYDIIISFTANSKIIRYVSPVGNSDSPYPYAVDEHNNYYFLMRFGREYDEIPRPSSEYKYIQGKDIPVEHIKEKEPYKTLHEKDKSIQKNIKNVKIIDPKDYIENQRKLFRAYKRKKKTVKKSISKIRISKCSPSSSFTSLEIHKRSKKKRKSSKKFRRIL